MADEKERHTERHKVDVIARCPNAFNVRDEGTGGFRYDFHLFGSKN